MSRKRKLKELTDADIAACEPESIWLETRRCPLPAHAVLWVVVCLLLIGIAWACVAKVDKVVAAEGKLVTTRPDITLKPLERAVVKSIDVCVGQVVEEGQVLVTFDPTVNAAQLSTLQSQKNTFLCQFLRLQAEQNGSATFELPAELAETEAGRLQQQLWAARKAYYADKLAWHRETVDRYAATAGAVQKSLEKYEELMQPMYRIEKTYMDLAAKGITAQVSAYQMQMQRISNEIEIEKQQTGLVEDLRLERTAKAEQAAFETEWQRDIAGELVETQLRIAELDEKIREVAYLASIENMKSPCRAVVHEIAPFQEGSGVREAESIISLIPIDAPLEAQVDVLPKDVGLLRRGDCARIKLEAFPFQQHGTLQGQITLISANTYESAANPEENPNPTANAGRQAQYRARLSLCGDLKHVPASLWRHSGMKLRAEIKVGERSVISYLLNPFLKAMDESIREP